MSSVVGGRVGRLGGGGVKPNFRYRPVMSLAAALGFFPMISEPGGRCQDKVVAGDCTEACLF